MGEEVYKIMEVIENYMIIEVGHLGLAGHNYVFEFYSGRNRETLKVTTLYIYLFI